MNATPQPYAKKILVVDDHPVVQRALSLALGARGYEVFTAVGDSEALGFARLERLDLILLNVFIPPDIRQCGTTWNEFRIIEWMQRVSRTETVPIIVISEAEPEEFKNHCLAAGAAAFFPKPINIPGLLDTIGKILKPGVDDEASELTVGLPPPIDSSRAPLPWYL